METTEAIYNVLETSFAHSTLDRDFLIHHGGIVKVSLTNMLTNDKDDDELHRQPTIISHSSYYDVKDLIPVLVQYTNH